MKHWFRIVLVLVSKLQLQLFLFTEGSPHLFSDVTLLMAAHEGCVCVCCLLTLLFVLLTCIQYFAYRKH